MTVRTAALVGAILLVSACGDEPPPPVAPPPAAKAPELPAPAPEPEKPSPPPESEGPPLDVLYVEETPRWEFMYLSNALLRSRTVRLSTWLTMADPQSPPRNSPDAAPVDVASVFSSVSSLARFDVIILGDVDPSSLLDEPDGATRALTSLRDYVANGGGLAVVAGGRHTASTFLGTPLEPVLPVEFGGTETVAEGGLTFEITQDGERCAYVDVARDLAASRQRWQTPAWRQYWVCPVRRARTGARVVLALRADPASPALPAVVEWERGSGRVVFVGVDELWRIRHDVGDRYFFAFWGGALRWLGTAPR